MNTAAEAGLFQVQITDAPMLIFLGLAVAIAIGLAIFFFIVLRKSRES